MLKKLGRLIFGNFRTKLLALVIALGVWFYANARVAKRVSLEATVIVSPPPGHEILYQSHGSAHLRLAGPDYVISRIEKRARRNSLHMLRKLSEDDLREGRAALSIGKDWLDVDLPEREMVQVSLESVEPGMVSVFVSPTVEKVLPVEVRLSGSLPEGFSLKDSPTARPPEVRVSGPAVALEALDSLPTKEVALWDLRAARHLEERQLQGSVETKLPGGRTVSVPLRLERSQVTVVLEVIEEARKQKTFAGVPLGVRVPPTDFPYQWELEGDVRFVDITIEAPPSKIEGLEAGSLRPYLDLAPLAREKVAPGQTGLYREPVRLAADLPGARVGVEPETVTVVLKNPAQ